VVLYSVPQTHIDDITVVTGIEGATGTVEVTVRLNGGTEGHGSVRLSGRDGDVSAAISFSDGTATVEPAVANARCWSDTDPYLYELTVTFGDDRSLSRVARI
jgi:beta-glucuronidase